MIQIIDPSAIGTTDFVKWGFNPTKKKAKAYKVKNEE